MAVGSASLSTSLLSAPLVSSANATPNPIWRLALPSVDFFRRSTALDSGAAVVRRRRRDMKMGLELDLLMQRGGGREERGMGDGK